MNEFFLYEQLCALERIAKQYPGGQDCAARTRTAAEQLMSQIYRVAVIGEFKKGKSSLINALLGSEVLPTDILPMTAAVNRVVYGEKKSITIYYKSGEKEDRTIEEIIDFGTKLDAQKALRAQAVREIVVHYPSVFCRNHIELIDTPGLNDNELMTEVTWSILGDVDAAIFVTSARAPMSITEQGSVLTLIEQPGIRHILFIITCIDAFSSHSEQERIIELVRSRLAENTLEAARDRWGEDSRMMSKARQILAQPDLYAVSSLLAIKGFLHDDEDLLEESRFPGFKNSLLDYLTAAQSMDTVSKTMAAAAEVSKNLSGWYTDAERSLPLTSVRIDEQIARCEAYLRNARTYLTGLFRKMDTALEGKGLLPDGQFQMEACAAPARKLFIARLSRLRSGENTHEALFVALRLAAREAEDLLRGICRSMESLADAEMGAVTTDFITYRQAAGFSPQSLTDRIGQWRSKNRFPDFRWTAKPIPDVPDLSAVDVMPQVNAALNTSLRSLGEQIGKYIASWRAVFLQQAMEDQADSSRPEALRARLEQAQQEKLVLQINYTQHCQQLQEILGNLRGEGGSEINT